MFFFSYISSNLSSVISIDIFMEEMSRSPRWLENNFIFFVNVRQFLFYSSSSSLRLFTALRDTTLSPLLHYEDFYLYFLKVNLEKRSAFWSSFNSSKGLFCCLILWILENKPSKEELRLFMICDEVRSSFTFFYFWKWSWKLNVLLIALVWFYWFFDVDGRVWCGWCECWRNGD